MSRNLTLLTDLYQLTMAQGYWENGEAETEACFYSFFRENPFGGGYAVVCGSDQVAKLVEDFGFSEEDIDYLRSIPAPDGSQMFSDAFLAWLRQQELSVDISVVPDGSVVFPREPLLRVIGPLWQCQLIETCVLNGVNFQTLIATKAARVCYAAQGRPVAEFGLRRAQGPDGGMSASRACYIAGCGSVANVLAGKEYGIPVSGTHAHSWVMSFDDELEAFRAYAKSQPSNCTLLVDTYDVEQGVRNAIIVGKEMEARGEHLNGVRIDSGDLAWLSNMARKMLDEAGMQDVGIVLSNDLDERTIEALIDQGATFTGLGVGTHLATGGDQAALGGVYKLSAIRRRGEQEWSPRIKVSEQTFKMTIPGVLDTRRYYDDEGLFCGDVVFDIHHEPSGDVIAVDPMDGTHRKRYGSVQNFETLLQPLAIHGKLCGMDLSAQTARKRCEDQMAHLGNATKRFLNPHVYPAGIERGLFDYRTRMIMTIRGLEEMY